MQAIVDTSSLNNIDMATVETVTEGRITRIQSDGNLWPVVAQSESLLHCGLNDTILFCHTRQGAVVISKLITPTEINQYPLLAEKNQVILQCGPSHLQLFRQGNIQIKNKTSAVKLKSNGTLELNGEQIQQTAKKNIRLNADQNILLNCD